MKLRTKLLGVGLLSFVAYAFVAGVLIKGSMDDVAMSERVGSELVFLDRVSTIVNEVQLERGKSATYLNNSIGVDEIIAQRRTVDNRISEFRANIDTSGFDEAVRTELLAALREIQSVRELVDGKGEISTVISDYSRILNSVLSVYMIAAEEAGALRVSGRIISLRTLEEAKENAGKLRAGLTVAIAQDVPIPVGTYAELSLLFGGMRSNFLAETRRAPVSSFLQIPAIGPDLLGCLI